MQTAVKTLKIRVKDKHASVLRRMARDVNQVFNFANETSSRAQGGEDVKCPDYTQRSEGGRRTAEGSGIRHGCRLRLAHDVGVVDVGGPVGVTQQRIHLIVIQRLTTRIGQAHALDVGEIINAHLD